MTEKRNFMQEYTTLAGVTLEEAVTRLKEMLPPDAYTSVPGGASLTDISPAYLTEVVTDVFGLIGAGWQYRYDTEDLEVYQEERKKTNGGTYTVWVANLTYMEVMYVFSFDGAPRWSVPVIGTGNSENENKGYAVRGAVTNALGAAFAKMCWQLSVYQGKLSHKNAAALWAKKHGTTPQKQTVTAQQKPAAPVAKQPAPAAKPAPQEPKPEVKPTEVAPASGSSKDLAWANTVIIPEGSPMDGKPLGDAAKDPVLGQFVVKWLTGDYPNAGGEFYLPQTDQAKEVQEAARLIYAANPTKKK